MITPRIIPDIHRQTLSSAEASTVDFEQTDCTCNHVQTEKSTDGSHYLPVITLQSFLAISDDFEDSPQTDDEISLVLENVLTEDVVIDDANINDATISGVEVDGIFPLPLGTEVPSVGYTDGIQPDEVADLIRFSQIRLGWNL